MTEREVRILRVASAGLGHQSTAMIIACILGEPGFPRLDAVTFADTGSERGGTYIHSARFREWCQERVTVLETVRKKDDSGSLHQAILDRLAGKRRSASPIPVHLKGGGRARQGCTRDWKQRQLDRHYKALAKKIQTKAVEVSIGYGVDEIIRVPGIPAFKKKNRWPDEWTMRFPLIEQGWDRQKSVNYIKEKISWPVIASMCFMCPHRPTLGPASFDEMRRTAPDDWRKAVEFDAAIRDGRKWGLRKVAYLSAMRLPLPEAVAEAKRQGVFGFAEGDGSCDGGVCLT